MRNLLLITFLILLTGSLIQAQKVEIENDDGSPAIRTEGTFYSNSIELDNNTQSWRNVVWSDNDYLIVKSSGSTFTPFRIRDESFSNAMVLGANGVGIGLSNPMSRFHVNFSGNDGIFLEGDDTGDAYIQIANGGGNHFIFDDDTDNHALKLESASGRALAFNTNGPNEKMRITSGGRLGINTTSPNNGLMHLEGSTNVYNGIHFTNANTGPGAADGFLVGPLSTNSTDLILWNFENSSIRLGTSGTERLTILGNGHVGIDNTNPDEDFVIGDNLGSGWDIKALTVAGTSGGAVEVGNSSYSISMLSSSVFSRARIISSSPSGFGMGEIEMRASGVKIGEDSSAPASTLHVIQAGSGADDGITLQNDSGGGNDYWQFEVGSNDLNVYYDSDGPGATARTNVAFVEDADGSWNTVSDRRLKENIRYYEDGTLNRVLKLKPATYNYIHAKDKSHISVGFIAQEVGEVFPELMRSADEGDTKALNYSDFGVLAIQAIKEQQEIINAQQELIKALEERVAKLERD